MRGKGDLLRKGRNVEKWGGGGLWEQGECLRHIGHTCGETRPTEPARRNRPAASPAAQLLEESRNANMTRL